MRAVQILVDGFAISSLYGLAAVGFTLIFGVSGVLNLAHGGIMVVAAIVGWAAAGEFGLGTYAGTLIGVIAGLVTAYATYLVVVRPIQRSRAIRPEETEIFVLTGTLLWGIMIQVGMAYLFSDNPVTMRPLIAGVVNIFGVRTPTNEILIAVIAWAVIGLLWLLVNRTRTGKALLGASINPRGVTLLGYELHAALSAGVDDLRRSRRHRRRAARVLSRRQHDQCRPAHRQRVLDRRARRARQRLRIADRGLCRRLSGNDDRLSDRADAAADTLADSSGAGRVCAAAGPSGPAIGGRE